MPTGGGLSQNLELSPLPVACWSNLFDSSAVSRGGDSVLLIAWSDIIAASSVPVGRKSYDATRSIRRECASQKCPS